MYISYNWLKKYLHRLPAPQKIAQILTQTGLEVSNLTSYNFLSPSLCIGEVVRCEKHPDADELQVAQVEIGKVDLLTIVCGASNLAQGQQVVVAPVGTELYNSDGTHFRIKKRKIRGVVSEGMICSKEEIGLHVPSQGIIVLDKKYPNGLLLQEAWEVPQDFIFEIDITPNRSDAISHLGVARELAAVLERDIEMPILKPLVPSDSNERPQLTVLEGELCPRYAGLLLQNVKVAPSPIWLQAKLKALGLTPVNNVVDVTNYVMHDMGQPLHAFDFQQIHKQHITVKKSLPGTLFEALNGVQYMLTGQELMICDELGPIAMAGVIGGERSKVVPYTTQVFLESAYFLPAQIVKTTKIHQLHTDASYRFVRSTDPHIVYQALQRAANLLQEVAEGEIASSLLESYPQPILEKKIDTSYSYLHKLIGIEIPVATIKEIFHRLDIKIVEEDQDNFVAYVPPYRADVTRPADLVEELLRIYGYNNFNLNKEVAHLELSSPFVTRTSCDVQAEKRDQIKDFLAHKGFAEIITNPLTSSRYTKWHKRLHASEMPAIAAPLSKDLDCLRQILLFSGLEVIQHNLNRGEASIRIFEEGKSYSYYQAHFTERPRIALWMAGLHHLPHWKEKERLFCFTDMMEVICVLLHSMGVDMDLFEQSQNLKPGYVHLLTLSKKGKKLIELGEVDPTLLKKMDIDVPVYYASIKLDKLIRLSQDQQELVYKPISHYPAVYRDLSLALAQEITFAQIRELLRAAKVKCLVDIALIDSYQDQKKLTDKKKSYTLRFTFQHDHKTLTHKEIQKKMDQITKVLQIDLQVVIR